MEYKFIKKNIGTSVDPSYDYGVDINTITDRELALEFLDWSGWTVSEVQKIIDKTKAIQGEDFFDYIVEGSELRICIDNEYVLFFDWRTETTDDDFRWTTVKFLAFMEAFKEFLRENGK